MFDNGLAISLPCRELNSGPRYHPENFPELPFQVPQLKMLSTVARHRGNRQHLCSAINTLEEFR